MSITRDINLISAEDLKLFTDLSQPIVDAVIAWRNQQPIVDLEELKKITGITDLELEVIRGVGFKAADKNQVTDHLPPPTLSIPNMRLVQDVMIPVSQTISVPALNQPNPFVFQPLAGDGSRSLFQERRNNERDQRDEEEGVDNGNTAPSAPIIPDTQGASAISLPVKLKDGSEVIALQIPPCYCLTAWILLGGSGDGDGQGASALGQGAQGTGMIRTPTQVAINKISGFVTEASKIIGDQCGFQFCLCNIYVLDTRQVRIEGGTNLSDELFTGPKGAVNGIYKLSGNTVNAVDQLYKRMVTNKTIAKFFPFQCINIFFVKDIRLMADKKEPDDKNTAGFSGIAGEDTPVVLVEGTTGRTLAHEIGHSLGLPHAKDMKSDKAVQKDKNNLMQEFSKGENLMPSQCKKMKKGAAQLSVGCPSK